MKKILATLILCSAILPVIAQPYYLAGSFNGWTANGTAMTETSSGIWQATITGATPGRHEFKVTGGDWSWSYPGANSWLNVPASGEITVSYDVNTYSDGWSPITQRLGLSYDLGTWTAAGSFQGWNYAGNSMTSLGSGVYVYQVADVGTWEWKAVVTGSWDSVSLDGRSVNTGNQGFTVNSGEIANLYVDALKGMIKVEIVAVPEPATTALLGLGALLLLRRRR